MLHIFAKEIQQKTMNFPIIITNLSDQNKWHGNI